MKRASLSRISALALGVALTQLPATASACSACMGNPNSKTAGAINDAIFTLLACIVSVLGLLAAFAFYLMRRANAPRAALS